MQQTTPSNNPTENSDALFEHKVKPEWGLAVLAWTRDGRSGYQFEDGKLRVFKEDYLHFLRPVDRPRDEADKTVTELNRKLGRRRAAKRLDSDARVISLAEQVEYFKSQFPKGFQGVKWAKKHRGIDAKKRLKRHRDATISEATELLDVARLKAKLDAGESLAILADLEAVWTAADWVTKAQLKNLDRVTEALAAQIAGALIELLTEFSELNFDRWVSALGRGFGKKPSWQVATTPLALVSPRDQICVKLRTFAKQATWMAPNLILERRPFGRHYSRVREMIVAMVEKLAEHGLRPRDWVYVCDFINLTLRPKALKEIEEAASGTADSDQAAA